MDDAGSGRRGLKPTLTVSMARAVAGTWGCDLEDAVPLGGSTGLKLLTFRQGRQVVVRIHRAHVTEARVHALQLARDATATVGVPAARAIPGRGGTRWLRVDSSVVEVEEFIASDNKMDSVSRITAAMPMLARLHDALATAEVPDGAGDAEFANYLSAREATSRTAIGARRIRTLGTEWRPLAAAAEDLAHDLDAATGPTFDALPSQWCHGDFWDDNVRFRGDEIVLVADFGFMGARPRVDDIALTAYFMLWDLVVAGHEDPLGMVAELAASYDRGTVSPLTDSERDALPLAVARQQLWSIGVWAAELVDPDEVVAHLRGHEVALLIGRQILDSADRWRGALRR